jgi:hypothetical protein
MPAVFDNAAGGSWKVANVCDQVLRLRLAQLPHNILIHEGVFRVTFSNRDCWLWDEFGLATEKNLEIFKSCGLSFRKKTIEESAKKLVKLCGDLWPDVETVPHNGIYNDFLIAKKASDVEDLKKKQAQKLLDIEKDIKSSKIELAAFQWLIEHDVNIDNCIYYNHTGRFCFGWRSAIDEKALPGLVQKLAGFPYEYDIKKTKTAENIGNIVLYPKTEIFKVIDTVSVPHAYCIGAGLMNKLDGGILDAASIRQAEKKGAHCGMEGCRLSYDEHKQALLIEVNFAGELKTAPGLQEYLKSIKDQTEKDGFQGWAFKQVKL